MVEKVVIDGDKGIQRMFGRLLESNLRDDLTEIMDDAAGLLQEEMKARAPVRTGNLRDNIIKEDPEVKPDEITLNVGPNKQAFYARFIELGTSKAPPHPFMRQAAKSKQAAVNERVATGIRNLIDREARKQ